MRSLGLATVVAFSVLAPSAAFGQLSITNYQFVSEQRVSLTKSNVTYRAALVNTDGALASVTATLTSLNTASFTVVPGQQDTLQFAPVPANSQVPSSNTFTILVDRTVPFDSTFSQLKWTFNPVPIKPKADAGLNQMATVGQTVTLDGSKSTNPSGMGTLTYSWAFTSRPAGSAAALSNPTSVMPTFVVDVAGNYVIALTVSNGVATSDPSTVTVSTTCPPPVANAGMNQVKTVGSTVVLNGSGSSSACGKPLTYSWTLTGPAGSTATLTGANTVAPTFVPDKVGTYTAQLIVNDGTLSSAPATVTISTSCAIKPVANAGTAQVVNVSSLVQLNGAGSTDACGLPLTYQWSLITLPANSTATLSNSTIVNPAFTADQAGTYVAQLIVNNGTLSSDAATVTITANPVVVLAPTANAGPNQTVQAPVLVKLMGSGTDPQNLPLTFKWSLTTKPVGSAATLSSTTISNPTFMADLAGTYIAQLIVNNGSKDSAPSTVTITTTCSQPTANPGATQNVLVGATVTLNGSASGDACNDPLTYAWSFTTRPMNSNATLSGATTVSPAFVADLVGTYVVQLIVNNGLTSSNPVTVTINAGSLSTIALTPNPLTVSTNAPGTLTVTLSSMAGAGGQVINLASSNTSIATVPATVTVPGGATSTTVQVTGIAMGSATITGSAMNFTSGTATVNVVMPAINVPANTTVGLGCQSTPFAVSLSQPAPAGGVTVTLTSSDTSKVTIPASVFIAAGATTPATQPQVTGAGIGLATITAAATGYTSGSGTVTVTAPAISFTPSTLSITVGATGNLTLNLAGCPAPAGGLVINLSSSDTTKVTVPATVSFAAGATSVPVTVTGVGGGSATITASATGITSATATVNVAITLINVPATTSVGLGLSATFAVTLSAPAPAGGVTVTLTSSDTTKVTVPASVFIAAGATTPATQPQVTGAGIGAATITASATGYTSGNGTVTVTPPTMSFSPATLTITAGSTGNLTLNLAGGQAPAGGLTVNLSSGTPGVATVPASVSFAAGATSASVTVTGVVMGSATITASATGIVSATAAVTVSPVPTINVATVSVGLGQSATFAVTLSLPAPAGGVTVTLTSSDTSKVTIPASVFIAAGATTPATQPQVTGVGIGSATITAAGTGYTSGTGTVTVTPPTMSFSPTTLSINVGTTGTLTLNLTGGQAPAGGLTVTLSSSDTSKATVPASVSFAAGATSANVTVTGVASGSATITASATGIVSATAAITVTPPPSIAVPATTTVGLGQSATFAVTLSTPAPAGGVTVTLTSSDTTKVTVPATVFIAAGATIPATQPQVTGAGIGSATITAAATGYQSGTGTVNVTPPTLSFTPPTLSVNVGATGNLTLNLTGGQAPAGGLVINLSSSDTSKATVPASVSFAAGATSANVTVTGVAMGSVTITASATGIVSATATVNVVQPSIGVPATTTVGLGLSATFAVTLSSPAPAGGLTVTLTSSDTTKVTVPASVSIAAGATTPTTQPQVTGFGIGSATVTASAPNYTSGSGTVTVTAPTLSFTPITLSIAAGATGTLTLNMTGGQGPPGGLTVNLSSSDTSVATVPVSVNFAPGVTSVPVTVTGVIGGTATITTSASGIQSTSASVTVRGGFITVPANTTVQLGQSALFAVSLSLAAPAGGVTVTLTSSDPTKVTVPATVFIAAGATMPATQPQATGAGIGSATITAAATGYTPGSGMVIVGAPTMSFAGPLSVAAGSTGTLTLNLTNGQAPAGSLTVSLSSSDTSKATVPATATFAAGATSTTVTVTGVAVGSSTITASAAGINNATALVTVTQAASIMIPATSTVLLGQTTAYMVSLSSPAPAGGVIVMLSSSDSSKVKISASVSIAAGATTPATPAQVTGAGIGSATITASATGYAPASGTVTVPAPTLNFSPNTLTLNAGTQNTLTLTLSNGQAPAGGLLVNLISSNNGIATVPGTVTFLAGMASVVVTPVTGVSQGTAMITASTPGIAPATATVTVGPPINPLIQPILVPSVSVGQNLQTSITIQLLTMMSCSMPSSTCAAKGPMGVLVVVDAATQQPVLFPAPAPAGGLIVSVTSSDPTKVLIASNAVCPGVPLVCGAQQVKFGIPEGSNSVSGVYLQGLASSGTVTITASAQGFPSGQGTVTLTPSGFLLSGPGGTSFTTNAGSPPTPLTVTSSRLDSSLRPVENQAVRAGYNNPLGGPFDDAQGTTTCNALFTDPAQIQDCEASGKYAFVNLSGLFSTSVTVTSSNPPVGTILGPAVFNGGDTSSTVQFKPDATNTGSTTLTAVAPAGFSTPASGNTVTANVNAAGISCGTVTVGKSLEAIASCTFQGGTPTAGLAVTITSSDTSKFLLSAIPSGSTSCTDPGSTFITVTTTSPPGRPDLVFIPNFCVYGLVSSGTANYTVTAPGFAPSNGLVNLAPSGFVIAGPGGIGAPSFAALTSTTPITVASALLDAGLNFVSVQPLAIGQSVNVTVTSSNPAVGDVSPKTVTITGGSSSTTTTFTSGTGSSGPCLAGSVSNPGPCTELDVVQPAGFSTPAKILGSEPAPTGVIAKVPPKGFGLSCNTVTIGKDLEASCTVTIGTPAGAGGQPVTLTSNNSSLLLLSATASGAGSTTLPLTIPAGSTSVTYYAQGLQSSGTVTHSASAPGFTTATATTPLAPSGVILVGRFGFGASFFTTSLGGGPVPVTVFLDVLNPSAASCSPQPAPCATGTTQALRGGLPSVQVSLTSSNTAVGTISSPVTIVAGSDNGVAQFTPKSQGSTTLTLVTPVPGFTTSTTQTTLTATVTTP